MIGRTITCDDCWDWDKVLVVMDQKDHMMYNCPRCKSSTIMLTPTEGSLKWTRLEEAPVKWNGKEV